MSDSIRFGGSPSTVLGSLGAACLAESAAAADPTQAAACRGLKEQRTVGGLSP